MSEQLLSDSQINVNSKMEASRLTYTSLNQAVLEPVDLKAVSSNELCIETLYSGISRGTEKLIYSGLVPISEHERMQCPHQVGEFTFPITYGYACVGKVIEVGTSVSKAKVGDHVFVLHPHQTRFVVSEDWVNVIPANFGNLRKAVLAANMETALNANWDAESETAGSIAIIGAGVVGLLTAYIAKSHSGLQPVIIDIDPDKRSVAEKMGFRFLLANEALHMHPQQFDCVFHTSASQEGLRLGLKLADFEGRIIEMSWYGEKEVSIPLGGAFHSQRLQLVSSQVGHVAKSKRAIVTHADRMTQAIALLRDPILEDLLFPVVPFTQLPNNIDEILTSGTSLCPLVTY